MDKILLKKYEVAKLVVCCEVRCGRCIGRASRQNCRAGPSVCHLNIQHTQKHCTLIQLQKEQHLVRKIIFEFPRVVIKFFFTFSRQRNLFQKAGSRAKISNLNQNKENPKARLQILQMKLLMFLWNPRNQVSSDAQIKKKLQKKLVSFQAQYHQPNLFCQKS